MSEQPVGEPALFAVKQHEQPSLFVPENLLREARRQRRLPESVVPRVVLLDPDGDILLHLRSLGQARAVASWACYHSRMWATEIGGVPVGVVPYAVGGPYAVLIAEQAFASGCRLLLSITSAGRIAEIGVDPPYYVVIDRAWRDEGTSLHYLPPSE